MCDPQAARWPMTPVDPAPRPPWSWLRWPSMVAGRLRISGRIARAGRCNVREAGGALTQTRPRGARLRSPVQWPRCSGLSSTAPVQWPGQSGPGSVAPVAWPRQSGTCGVAPLEWPRWIGPGSVAKVVRHRLCGACGLARLIKALTLRALPDRGHLPTAPPSPTDAWCGRRGQRPRVRVLGYPPRSGRSTDLSRPRPAGRPAWRRCRNRAMR